MLYDKIEESNKTSETIKQIQKLLELSPRYSFSLEEQVRWVNYQLKRRERWCRLTKRRSRWIPNINYLTKNNLVGATTRLNDASVAFL